MKAAYLAIPSLFISLSLLSFVLCSVCGVFFTLIRVVSMVVIHSCFVMTVMSVQYSRHDCHISRPLFKAPVQPCIYPHFIPHFELPNVLGRCTMDDGSYA